MKITSFEVKKFDIVVHLVDVKRLISFAKLILHIDFVIPNKFNNVECKVLLFSMPARVILELKQVFHARILILQHFKT